jgi:nitroreductase
VNGVIDLLKSHRSIRKFEERPVEEDKVNQILECAQCAATSSFMQAYTIIRVDDRSKRAEIARIAGGQKDVEECPLFLVFCADLSRHKLACEMNGTKMEEGYTEPFIIATVDAALAAQNAMVAAESMGLGGVYIGGMRNNLEEVSTLLNIPQNAYPVFGMCLGYPAENPDIKPRMPMELILKHNEYTSDGDVEKLRKYDEFIVDYYWERTGGAREDTWTGMMADKLNKPVRPDMRKFLEGHGFNMK